MASRFHGIDQHKKCSTICVLDHDGGEVEFITACHGLKLYISSLGSEDAVVLEASTGSFWWADQIELHGAIYFVLDPHRFRIIKDSWNKTDKHDAWNMRRRCGYTWSQGSSAFLRCISLRQLSEN